MGPSRAGGRRPDRRWRRRPRRCVPRGLSCVVRLRTRSVPAMAKGVAAAVAAAGVGPTGTCRTSTSRTSTPFDGWDWDLPDIDWPDIDLGKMLSDFWDGFLDLLEGIGD